MYHVQFRIRLFFIILFVILNWCSSLTSEQDYDVLHIIYDEWNGDNWRYPGDSISTTWNFTGGYSLHNPCGDAWQGIVCSNTVGYCGQNNTICSVTMLNLTLYNCVGTIPLALSNFTNISHMLLDKNSIYGQLHSFVTSIPSLIELELSFNELSGLNYLRY